MNDAEAFRKALLRQAYIDFLDWAWKKDEIMQEWVEYLETYPDTDETFTCWVTETYWGEVE